MQPQPYGVLRDRSGATRVLVLAHFRSHPEARLADAARAIGVTIQAVSTYVRQLMADGHLHRSEGAYQVTPRGEEQLRERVRALTAAVDELAGEVADVPVTSAVAHAPIRPGQQVRLWMDGGDLAAAPGAGSSTGTATHAAEFGDEVIVTGLAGVAPLEPGRIHIISLPGPAEGGIAALGAWLDGAQADPAERSRTAPSAPLPSTPKSGELVAALGTGARILAGRRHGRVDLDFAATEAAFNAAERGMNVRFYVTRDHLARTLDQLEARNAHTLQRIRINVGEDTDA